MMLLDATNKEGVKVVKALAPMCGIGFRGVVMKLKDIEDILTLDDK